MPLPRVRNGYNYTSVLLTFGPVVPSDPTALRHQIKELCQRHCSSLNDQSFVCAFEVSEKGYPHCHVAVGFTKPTKAPLKLLFALKALALEEHEGKKRNGSMHYVPIDKKHQTLASSGGRFGVLKRYLTEPHKTKECDDGALDFTETSIDVLKDLERQLFTCYGDEERKRIWFLIQMKKLGDELRAANN